MASHFQRKYNFKKHYCVALVLSLLLVLAFSHLNAQKMLPDAPMRQFQMPLFADNGYKKWELWGEEGRYLGADKVLVLIMTLRVFSADAEMDLESVIMSPDATIDLKKKIASGDNVIKVRAPHYRLKGHGWEWLGKENRIVVKRDARVELDQSIGQVLR